MIPMAIWYPDLLADLRYDGPEDGIYIIDMIRL